jgi:hypothetical protein
MVVMVIATVIVAVLSGIGQGVLDLFNRIPL